MMTTSWVASTYRARPSKGNVVGLLSNVELVVELYCEKTVNRAEERDSVQWLQHTVWIGVLVNLATNS